MKPTLIILSILSFMFLSASKNAAPEHKHVSAPDEFVSGYRAYCEGHYSKYGGGGGPKGNWCSQNVLDRAVAEKAEAAHEREFPKHEAQVNSCDYNRTKRKSCCTECPDYDDKACKQ